MSAGLLHNTVNSRKAKARTFALFFGREERFEEVGAGRRVEAGPVIADLDALPASIRETCVATCHAC